MADKKEPNFDDFDLLGDERSLEPLPEFGSLDDLSTEVPTEPVDRPAQIEPLEPIEGPQSLNAEQPEQIAQSDAIVANAAEVEKESKAGRAAAATGMLDRLPVGAGWLGIGGLFVLFLLLWLVGVLYLPTGVLLIAIASVCYGMWSARQTSSVYTAILGVAVIAVLMAVYFLWTEYGTYNFDRKASQLRPGVSMTAPSERTLV